MPSKPSPTPRLCPVCLDFMRVLLNERMSRILEVGREEQTDESDGDIGQSHCFHLMELLAIIEGRKTCGVFDSYGPELTIDGPLFDGVKSHAE